MTLAFRIYIFENDQFTKLALIQKLNAFDLMGAFESLPPDAHKLSEADAVVLDPRIFPKEHSPTRIVLDLWRRFPNRVKLILHTDAWSQLKYREAFEDLGVTNGFRREDYTHLFDILTELMTKA